MQRYDLAVVGGGIAGAFASYCAAKRGLRTALLEASTRPNGATAKSGGIVTRMLDDPRDALLANRSLKLILEAAGGDCDFISFGYLSIEDEEDAEEDARRYRRLIPDIKVLDPREIRERWPFIRLYEEEAGLYSPSDITVDPGKLLERLWSRLGDMGVDMYAGCPVASVVVDGGSVEGVETKRGVVRADRVIVAAGAWTRDILARLGVGLNTRIISIPLYCFSVDTRELVGVWDDANYSYWRPGGDAVIIGGGYDAYPVSSPDSGFTKPPLESLEYTLRLLRYRFSFGRLKLVDCWMGPVSVSPTYEPIMARVPGIKGLYIIDGLAGYGLMRGPALAERLVEKIAR